MVDIAKKGDLEDVLRLIEKHKINLADMKFVREENDKNVVIEKYLEYYHLPKR